MFVSDGRIRQMGSGLSEGHVTSDEQPPNVAPPTHSSHTPGTATAVYTEHTHAASAVVEDDPFIII